MEAKVIRSGDKNFKEEKVKMFEPKTLNKEEQLKIVFTHLFASMITEYIMLVVDEPDELIEKYTNIFMREVKIRTKL